MQMSQEGDGSMAADKEAKRDDPTVREGLYIIGSVQEMANLTCLLSTYSVIRRTNGHHREKPLWRVGTRTPSQRANIRDEECPQEWERDPAIHWGSYIMVTQV